jgi:DNA-binding transcriptional ArsR family regulator
MNDIIHSMSQSPPGLLPIFRSDHQLRLIGHLFVHSGKAFSLAELRQATRISQPTVSREIKRLGRAGLVRSQTKGRMKLVEANDESPYFAELNSLMLKAVGPAEEIRKRLSRISGVEEAYIFGSWARRYKGELGPPPADIDVLAIGDPNPDDVASACRRAERSLKLEVNPVVLSRHEWESRSSGFVRQLRKNALVNLIEQA